MTFKAGAGTRIKTVQVPYQTWRRARICSIELDVPLREWVIAALTTKADLQEKAGKLRGHGARVASVREVTPMQEGSDGKS